MATEWNVGNQVEVEWNGAWYPAQVLQVGEQGFLVAYDGYDASSNEWVGPERIRARAAKHPFVRPAIAVEADYRARFERMVRELSERKDLQVDEVRFGDPVGDDEIARAAREAGGTLPVGLEAFCREMNGFTLRWRVTGGTDSDVGSIVLLPLHREGESIFGDWKDIVWFDGFEGAETYKRVKPFDFFTNEACAAFYPVPGGEPTVHYHCMGESLEPTGYTFPEYIELLLRSRGYWYWQLALCVDEQEATERGRLRERMPQLFADHDETLFRPATEKGTLSL